MGATCPPTATLGVPNPHRPHARPGHPQALGSKGGATLLLGPLTCSTLGGPWPTSTQRPWLDDNSLCRVGKGSERSSDCSRPHSYRGEAGGTPERPTLPRMGRSRSPGPKGTAPQEMWKKGGFQKKQRQQVESVAIVGSTSANPPTHRAPLHRTPDQTSLWHSHRHSLRGQRGPALEPSHVCAPSSHTINEPPPVLRHVSFCISIIIVGIFAV